MDNAKAKQHLRLIEGGLVPKEQADKEFVSAFATDTRLMGEIAMGIHWHIKDHPDAEELYQFFSFDTEEQGLDNYKSVWESDGDAIAYIRQTMIGPLGGKDVPLTEKEARALFTKYHVPQAERRNDTDSPDNIDVFSGGIQEYRFLMNDPVILSDEDYKELFSKLCTQIISDEQLVNYYLMRCLAKDTEGMLYLSDHSKRTGPSEDIFSDLPLVSLLKNTIHKNGSHFISHSLVEHDNRYELLVTDITSQDLKISSCTRIPGMAVSGIEAALMLAHPEFITVYRIISGPEEFEEYPLEFDYNTMITDHNNGRMYMAFNNNNDHVNSSAYNLSDDIFGLYYITRSGEFIVSAGSRERIIQLERKLLHSPIGVFLLPTGKYEFQEPVLLNFVNSDFEDFDDFLQAITDPEL